MDSEQPIQRTMNSKTRILSIDGGGIRGIIPAVILNYIEKGLQRQSGNPNATLSDFPVEAVLKAGSPFSPQAAILPE